MCTFLFFFVFSHLNEIHFISWSLPALNKMTWHDKNYSYKRILGLLKWNLIFPPLMSEEEMCSVEERKLVKMNVAEISWRIEKMMQTLNCSVEVPHTHRRLIQLLLFLSFIHPDCLHAEPPRAINLNWIGLAGVIFWKFNFILSLVHSLCRSHRVSFEWKMTFEDITWAQQIGKRRQCSEKIKIGAR